ncbi:hypothetical protein [Mycobacterium uberis]|uniref:hypothetical protein n=1 Tax=Mycobacterium uberis TaxID=2162698 RepID=UPI001FB392F8|nr:hypothetical protein [Mycobacterium uberis]
MQVRRLAATASLRFAYLPTSSAESLRYQLLSLERAVRYRYLAFSISGCSRLAIICDIYHTISFNRQATATGRLAMLNNLK